MSAKSDLSDKGAGRRRFLGLLSGLLALPWLPWLPRRARGREAAFYRRGVSKQA